jgi:hypothetical protein
MFSEADRQIFAYTYAGKQRYADPLAAYDRLLTVSRGKVRELLQAQREGDPEQAAQARLALSDHTRAAFQLPPVDPDTGVGLNNDAAIRLLDLFLGWLKKKETTSPPERLPTFSARFAERVLPSTTPTSSDCGCS